MMRLLTMVIVGVFLCVAGNLGAEMGDDAFWERMGSNDAEPGESIQEAEGKDLKDAEPTSAWV